MSCRAGCPTKDCASYAECIRGVKVLYSDSTKGFDYSREKHWNKELDRYGTLVKSGIQPEGTTHRDMDRAERKAERVSNR